MKLLPSSLCDTIGSPFCRLRDIFPQPGEVFLMEGGFGKIGNFPSSPEAPSVRELSSECETEGGLFYCFALMDFISPPAEMICWIKGGKGWAWNTLPLVSSVMTPVSKSTLTVSPA